jgi:hypothetical protein
MLSPRKLNFLKAGKRHILLLEVLIAFTLLVLCILPLFYPLLYILRLQSNFVSKIQLDHEVNLQYVDIVNRLYTNEINWSELSDGRAHEINLKDIPYKGFYAFSETIHKPREDQPYMVYLKALDFTFFPSIPPKNEEDRKKETLKYHYDICVIKDLGSGQ